MANITRATVDEWVEMKTRPCTEILHRPSSYVPARTLLTLLGRRPSDAEQPKVWNHLMHRGTGAAMGALGGGDS
jgi:hypothetical protein